MLKIDGRDLGFDALAQVCNVDVRNRARVSELTKSLKDIRSYAWDDWQGDEGGEPFERYLAAEIVRRAGLYRQAMNGATLTPLALAKWWHDVARGGPARGKTGDDFPEFQGTTW